MTTNNVNVGSNLDERTNITAQMAKLREVCRFLWNSYFAMCDCNDESFAMDKAYNNIESNLFIGLIGAKYNEKQENIIVSLNNSRLHDDQYGIFLQVKKADNSNLQKWIKLSKDTSNLLPSGKLINFWDFSNFGSREFKYVEISFHDIRAARKIIESEFNNSSNIQLTGTDIVNFYIEFQYATFTLPT